MDPVSALDFAKGDGLVTAVTLDDASGEVLMVAFMDEEAFRRTLATGEVHYYSRSPAGQWRKGEQSGHTQALRSVHIDCDGDCVLLRVEQRGGAACHTGRRSCFFRRLSDGSWEDVGVQVFDPEQVYGR